MKKLLIAMTAAAIVCAANAAGWISYTANDLAKGYNGYCIVAFETAIGDLANLDDDAKARMADELLSDAYWGNVGAKSWSEYYEAVVEEDWYSPGTVTEGSGTGYGFGLADTTFSVVFALFENGITAGSKYELFSTAYYTGERSASPSFDMSTATVIESGKLRSDAVPEPTSGLLMLLGMAGLALKRKRA